MDYTPGRNLLRKSATFVAADWAKARSTVPETGIVRCTPTTSSAYAKYVVDYLTYGQLKNQPLTFSCDVRDVETGTYSGTTGTVYLYIGVQKATRLDNYFASAHDRYWSEAISDITTEWKNISITMDALDLEHLSKGLASYEVEDTDIVSIEVYRAAKLQPAEFRNIKLEIGEEATAWTPAPEDAPDYPYAYRILARNSVTITHAVDIESYTRYYLLQSSTLDPPSVPTTDSPGGSWSTSEPTYTEGSTNSLYFVDKTKFTDGTFSYSDVSLSSEYEAAKTAYNLAHTAQATAVTANMKTVYATCPTAAGTPAKVATITPTTSDYALTTGDKVTVYFTYANTAATPTLDVNGKGAKTIRALRDTAFDASVYSWDAKTAVSFVYDGTYWMIENPDALAKANAAAAAAGNAQTAAEAAQGTADTALAQSVEYIVGTQSAATGSWTGVTIDTELVSGKTIAYKLPYAGSGNASLTLTLAGGGVTAAIPVYSMTTRVTTHYPANSIITMTYDGDANAWRTTGWYNSNNYDRRLHNNAIEAETAITKNFLIVGTDAGYKNMAAGAAFDLSYPILWASAAIAVTKTATSTYEAYPSTPFSTTGTIESGAANKMLYLKGTVSGNTFTIAASPFLTTVVPASADNMYYIPLGVMSSATAGYFSSSNRLYAYINGAFQPVDTAAQLIAEDAAEMAALAADTAASAEKHATALYGTCTTAAGTAAKVVTLANFSLFEGATITVYFSAANSAAAPTLNVNETGAKAIYFNGANASSSNLVLWGAKATMTFVYTGSVWKLMGQPVSYYGTCGTAAGTAAKTATVDCAVICKGTVLLLKMTNANTAASPTMNISDTGAKAIAGNSTVSWLAGETVQLIFNGTTWNIGDTSLRNHFWHDSDGAHIADSASQKNVLIDSDSVDIRNGTDVLASFAANLLELGKNNPSAVITMLNSLAKIMYEDNVFSIHAKHPLDGGPNILSLGLLPAESSDYDSAHSIPDIWMTQSKTDPQYSSASMHADRIELTAMPVGDVSDAISGTMQFSARKEIYIMSGGAILLSNASHSLEELQDWVVDKGLSGTQGLNSSEIGGGEIHWQKWASGKLEIWGRSWAIKNATINKSSWANGYESQERFTLWGTWPVPFVDVEPAVSYRMTWCDTASVAGDYWIIESPFDSSGSALLDSKVYTPWFKFWRGTSKTFGHPAFAFQAVGRWK